MKKAVAYLIPFIEQEKLDNPELATAKDTNGTIVMATVKGDVHDIGKNIVGVVLQCNNYEVIDLGVMVPAQKILDTAREIGADLIGLSGLITPSLDEMVNLAAEMQRQEFDHPAADRRRHDLARPHRGQDRRQVRRPRGLGQGRLALGAGHGVALLSDERRAQAARRRQGRLRLAARPPRGQERPAAGHAGAGPRRADAGRLGVVPPPRPHLLLQQDHASRRSPASGRTQHVRVFKDYDLGDLRRYIDWQPFFNAWEMKGSFPDILNNPSTGRGRPQALRRRPGDARPDRRRALAHRQRRGRPVPGQPRRRRHRGLPRRAARRAARRPPPAAPAGPAPRGRAQPVARRLRRSEGYRAKDHVGAFAVTAGLGAAGPGGGVPQGRSTTTARSCSSRSPTGWPRRSPSGCTSGCARELWGYAPDERLDNVGPDQGALRRHPSGPGLPRRPDHTEKQASGTLLDVEAHTGIELTESMAMRPGASVSGLYFSHPESQYFVVGRHRPRPGRGLRRTQGLDPRRGREVALA